MFGRIMSIEVFDKSGESTFLVYPNNESESLTCSGTIEYLPVSSGAPRATILVYNLPSSYASSLFSLRKLVTNSDTGEEEYVDDPKMIRIKFGYEDENDGELSTIFVGRVARAFSTRQDSTTSITKIYAYQLLELFNSALSSAQFDAGTTVYDCVDDLLKNSSVTGIEYELPDALKQYTISDAVSFYGKTLDCVNELLTKVDYLIVTTPFGVSFSPSKPTGADLDAVMLGEYDDTGKIVARSGLVGYPCIDTEGMRFETLINPRIMLYSYVWLPNSIVIDERSGFIPSTQFGATYDPAGLYRVTKMTTQFDSRAGRCVTSYVALSAGTSSAYYK